jgi:hypothetical protein
MLFFRKSVDGIVADIEKKVVALFQLSEELNNDIGDTKADISMLMSQVNHKTQESNRAVKIAQKLRDLISG